ncbi:RNA polymerase sigma factor [Novosphingobium sp.]|jgi:RNA polymerase sigma-70 factor (ECF subfamily)|uniref:RNA polymerase sigma factor n=1 Tax=Novosphingobium sp. TaxID=1874826 RepID=UPI002FE0A1AB
MSLNARALTRLLLNERSSLTRLVQRIVGDMTATEDVTQSLWLRVQRVDDHPPILNKRAYLFRLAANLARDQARSERRRHGLFEQGPLPEDIADDTPLADRQLLDREALQQLQESLAELSPRCREIVRLRRIENLSASEIAERLGISRQMVSRYIAQAMEHCLNRVTGDE